MSNVTFPPNTVLPLTYKSLPTFKLPVVFALANVVNPATSNVVPIVAPPETIKSSKPIASSVMFPLTVRLPPIVTLLAISIFVLDRNVEPLPPSVNEFILEMSSCVPVNH